MRWLSLDVHIRVCVYVSGVCGCVWAWDGCHLTYTSECVCMCQVFVAVCDYEIVVTSRTRQIVCVRCLWLCTSTRLKTRMRWVSLKEIVSLRQKWLTMAGCMAAWRGRASLACCLLTTWSLYTTDDDDEPWSLAAVLANTTTAAAAAGRDGWCDWLVLLLMSNLSVYSVHPVKNTGCTAAVNESLWRLYTCLTQPPCMTLTTWYIWTALYADNDTSLGTNLIHGENALFQGGM